MSTCTRGVCQKDHVGGGGAWFHMTFSRAAFYPPPHFFGHLSPDPSHFFQVGLNRPRPKQKKMISEVPTFFAPPLPRGVLGTVPRYKE